MNRKTLIRAALLSTPLVAALLYIALNWYTIENESVWAGAGPEARRDPYLAYARLIERMGGQPILVPGPSRLETLPPKATLVIGERRLTYMTPPRVRRLAEWVNRGGSLVVEAERYRIDDPLLDALGVQRSFPDMAARSRRNDPQPPRPSGPQPPASFDWPGADKPLRVRFRSYGISLRDAREHADTVSVKPGEDVVALAFSQGEGRVAVLTSLGFLRNNSIGEFDHAEFGWRLAGARDAAEPTLLFLVMTSPPLGDWLLNQAWPVVLAAMLLIALWLARIIPRFGPLAPDPPPVRRSLLEHIVAIGRFLWSRGEGAYLLEALRERVWRAANRRGIASQAVPQAQAIEAIAQLAGLPETTARLALAAGAATAPAFVETAAQLREIEARLERRVRATPSPSKKARP
jgi:hypothetical protein